MALTIDVDVTVAPSHVTVHISRLFPVRAIRRFEAERVRSVLVRLVDLLQDFDFRPFGDNRRLFRGFSDEESRRSRRNVQHSEAKYL